MKNPEALAILGQALRSARLAQGLTQSAAGKRVPGLRQATISQIERGADVTVDTLVSAAGALGLELALVPIGQGAVRKPEGGKQPTGLLEEFGDLEDRQP